MTGSFAATSTAAGLAILAGLHAAWGAGSSFPLRDRASLADTIAGTDDVPGPAECAAVAGLIATAAVLVADLAPIPESVRRVGVLGVAFTLGLRGGTGLTGRTGLLVPWTPAARFVRLDRRYYGPLCLTLALGALASLTE